ncbi:MAG: hypothetical protein HUJ51_01570 [Eggerthellaceae bacterium]|nr:hypothetical protein [Eggerthellaceae bacterium]
MQQAKEANTIKSVESAFEEYSAMFDPIRDFVNQDFRRTSRVTQPLLRLNFFRVF